MTVALFPAAGRGRRVGANKNKILLNLAGEPILLHTLRKFAKSNMVDYFIIIVAEREIEEVAEILKNENLPPYKIIAGGAERQYSVENGLKSLPKDTDIVLVHDAARPFVSVDTIEKVIDTAKKYGAAIAAVPEKNTVKEVKNGIVTATPKRENLWAATTPQGFKSEILIRAYEKARADNFLGTDDASLAERIGVPVHIAEDTYDNFKITSKSDLKIAEFIMRGENL